MEKVKRTVSLTLPLDKTAKDFGYKIEADSMEDVYHQGYSSSQVKNMRLNLSPDLTGVDKIFPNEVAICLEEEERNAIAREIVKKNKQALIEALEKINPGVVEYQDGDGEFVTIEARIVSASINEEDQMITVEILNPEHLINGMLCGEGMFGPEIDTSEPASNETLSRYFHHLSKYFDIYGESAPSSDLASHEQGDFNSDYFEEYLKDRLLMLTVEDVAESIKDLEREGDLNLEEVEVIVSKLTEVSMEEVKKNIMDSLEDDVSRWKNILK